MRRRNSVAKVNSSVKSYLLSELTRRFSSVSLGDFAAAHPTHWLLWEPGSWKPDQGSTTMAPAGLLKDTGPVAGEGLALVLLPGLQGQCTLGRGPPCDLIINDGTLSTRHLQLRMRGPEEWELLDLGSKNGTWVDGVRLIGDAPLPLKDGSSVQAGQVRLSYYAPAGMHGRLLRGRL